MDYKRIISLAPSITETVFALKQENRLVGITDYCNFPDATKNMAKIDGFITPNIDKILALKPDLILATTLHKVDKLEVFSKAGIKVKQVEAKEIFDAPKVVNELGKILSVEKMAIVLSEKLDSEMKTVFTKAKALNTIIRVCYLCTSTPFCNHKPKCQTNKLVGLLGGELCGFDKNNLAQSIIDDNPQVIIIPYKTNSEDYLIQQRFINDNPKIKETIAGKQNRIISINGELLSRPGPRAALGLNLLFKTIHNY